MIRGKKAAIPAICRQETRRFLQTLTLRKQFAGIISDIPEWLGNLE